MEEILNNGAADAAAEHVADGLPEGDEGRAAEDGKPSPVPAADPRIDQILKDQAELKKGLFESQQREAYWRGAATRTQETAAPVEEKEPEPFKPNLEEFRSAYEADPAKAFSDMAQKMGERIIEQVTFRSRKETGTALAGNHRQQQIAQQLQREGEGVARDYVDLIGKDGEGKPVNEEFDRECFDYAQKLAEDAGNPLITQGQWAGIRSLTPGMMRAAADAVFGKWAKANKLPAKKAAESASQPRTLRQIIDTPPASDNLGSRNGGNGNGAAGLKSIDDLLRTGFYKSSREADEARSIAKSMGVSEDRWVANVTEGMRNGEIDDG